MFWVLWRFILCLSPDLLSTTPSYNNRIPRSNWWNNRLRKGPLQQIKKILQLQQQTNPLRLSRRRKKTGSLSLAGSKIVQALELQRDQFEIADQTMTISPDQSPTPNNELSNRSEPESVASLSDSKNNKTDSLGKMPDLKVKPSLETASQSSDQNAQVETKEASSDKIKRLIAEMAASQSRASPSEREEGVAANKGTLKDQVTATKEKPSASVSSEIRPEPSDIANEKPPVKLPPVKNVDINPPVLSTQSTKPVLGQESPNQLAKEQPDKAGNKIARVEKIRSSEEKTAKSRLEDRLRSFLQNYCNTYAAKDLAKFTNFFSPGAQENGKPFESLIPKYQKNFDLIETIQYSIELQQYTYDSQKETVRIEGSFLLKWLPPDKKWRENSGKIVMNLKDDGRSFLVQRLDYYGSRQAN